MLTALAFAGPDALPATAPEPLVWLYTHMWSVYLFLALMNLRMLLRLRKALKTDEWQMHPAVMFYFPILGCVSLGIAGAFALGALFSAEVPYGLQFAALAVNVPVTLLYTLIEGPPVLPKRPAEDAAG